MSRVKIDVTAPEFVLRDFRGREVRLSDVASEKNVVLVFNRGFT
jgi:peroxiredoxin